VHPILGTVLQRILLGVVTLFFVSLIIFSAIEFLPGDFTQAVLGQAATEETVAAFRKELGLDQPAPVRYMEWIQAVMSGDLGTSFSGRNASGIDRSRSVVDLIEPRLPAIASVNAETPFWERVYKCILPALTMTLVIVAHMMRMTRAAIINLLASPYIEMARLKGISKSQVILRHALPNAWAPIATVIAFNLAYLVVGVVVVEVVFVYPGIGQLMVNSVTTRDIPVVQACALIFAATYIILNLIAAKRLSLLGLVSSSSDVIYSSLYFHPYSPLTARPKYLRRLLPLGTLNISLAPIRLAEMSFHGSFMVQPTRSVSP